MGDIEHLHKKVVVIINYYYYDYRFTHPLIILALVSSFAAGNNKLPREAKKHPLFAFFSSFYISSTFDS